MFRNLASSSCQPLNYETSMGLLDSCQTIFLSWPLQNSKTFFCARSLLSMGVLWPWRWRFFVARLDFLLDWLAFILKIVHLWTIFHYLTAFPTYFVTIFLQANILDWLFASEMFRSPLLSQIPLAEPSHRWPCYRAEQRQGSGFWKIIGSPWSLSLAAEVVLDPE